MTTSNNAPSPANILLAFVVMILLTFIILMLPGCTSTKHINKETESGDSIINAETARVRQQYEKDIAQLQSRIHELEYLGLTFDRNCDTTINQVVNKIIQSGCPQNQIDSFVTAIQRLRNKVKILTDGSVEAEGNIQNLVVTKNKMQETVANLTSTKQMLEKENQSLLAEVKKLKETKDKHTETSFLSHWWLLLIIGLAAGTWIGWKAAVYFKRKQYS